MTLGVNETEHKEVQLMASHVYCQKPITIASGQGVLAKGTVLGMLQTSYEFGRHDPVGSDGSETACAILGHDVDATGNAAKAEGFFLGVYRLSDLVWPEGITGAQKKAALADLQDRGILVDTDWK